VFPTRWGFVRHVKESSRTTQRKGRSGLLSRDVGCARKYFIRITLSRDTMSRADMPFIKKNGSRHITTSQDLDWSEK